MRSNEVEAAVSAKRAVQFTQPDSMMPPMTRDEILSELKKRKTDLHTQGVVRVALFGSVARGEQRDDSDIDILVELDPAKVVPSSITLG